MLTDREYILQLLKRDISDIMKIPDTYKNDKSIVLTALKSISASDYAFLWDSIFDYLPQHFRDDKEVAMEAMRLDGRDLSEVSERLKSDPDVVLTAIKNVGFALGYANEVLKNNPKFVLQAVEENETVIQNLPACLRDDPVFLLDAQKKCATTVLPTASDRLKRDTDFVRKIVKINRNNLKYVSSNMKKNILTEER